jgi:hypothetical protein
MKRQRFYEFEPKNADLPTFVLDVLGHLKQHGAEVEGIFRLTKDRDHSAEIIKGYSEGAKPDLSKYSVHAVAGAFGFYFSQLQEPLLTYPLYDVIKEAINIRSEETRVQLLKKAMRHLPVGNKAFLASVIDLFKYLLSYSDVNMLHIDYLTSVFGLSIWAVHPTAESLESSADWQKLCKRLLETLIYKYEELIGPKKQKKKNKEDKEDSKVNKKEFKKKLKRLSLATPLSPLVDHASQSSTTSSPYNSQQNSNSKLSSTTSSPSSRPTSPTATTGTLSKPLAIAIPIHQVHQHAPSPSLDDSANEFKGPFSAPTDSFDRYYNQQLSPRSRYGGNPYASPLYSVLNSSASNSTSGTNYHVHLEVPTIEDSLDSSLEDSSNMGSSKARRTSSKPVVGHSGGLDENALKALKHTKSIANLGKRTAPPDYKQQQQSRADGVDDRRVRTAVLSLIDHVIRGRTQQLHKYLTGLTRPELKQVSVELCYYIETIFKEQSESSSDEADSSEFSDELSEYQN